MWRHPALWSNISLLLVLTGISVGMRQPLLQQFSVIERQIMAKHVARVMEGVMQEAERLDTHATSEASWTEMHRYLGTDVARADPDFYRANYGESISNWDYDLLAMFDRSDQLRHLEILHAQTQKMQAASMALRQQLVDATGLRKFPSENGPALADSRAIGVLSNGGQALLLASRPVLKSTGKGPSHGTLVVGRMLNRTFLDQLVRNTPLQAELHALTPGQVTSTALAPEALPTGPIPHRALPDFIRRGEIEIVNDRLLAAALQLLDNKGIPRFAIRLTAPRLEYIQGREMLNKLTWILFALGLSLGAVITALLHRNMRHQQRLQASQAALHLTNLALEKLVNLDGLTKVANRRWFESYLENEWARALRQQSPLTLILCDIDYFKDFNDTYGHLAGDACLIEISGALKGILKRPSDMLARYGGEEFALILPETTLSEGKIVAEALLAAIRALKIPHTSAPSGAIVSASFGVACLTPQSAFGAERLIEQSDQNLYLAKNRGRNQVCAQ